MGKFKTKKNPLALQNLMHPLKTLKAKLVLRTAIMKANAVHMVHGVRYWVIPTPEGALAVLNWEEARAWKEKGILPKRMNVQGLYSLAFYWTGSHRSSNHGFSAAKPEINMTAYLAWWWNVTAKKETRRKLR